MESVRNTLTGTFELKENLTGPAIHLHLPVFEGPMDLLLYLIRRDEVDVFDIPIAHITREYLISLEWMQANRLEVGGEFLVMAATLLAIKARMLLPRKTSDDLEGGEEDPRRDLMERILEYKAFKESAQLFRQLEEEQSKRFPRGAHSLPLDQATLKVERALQEVSLFDLLAAFKLAVDRLEEKPPQYDVNLYPETVDKRTEQLRERLREHPRIAFSTLIEEETTRLAIIVIFLAILEMVRQGEIRLRAGRRNDFVIISQLE